MAPVLIQKCCVWRDQTPRVTDCQAAALLPAFVWERGRAGEGPGGAGAIPCGPLQLRAVRLQSCGVLAARQSSPTAVTNGQLWHLMKIQLPDLLQALTHAGDSLVGKCFPSAASPEYENVKLGDVFGVLGVPSLLQVAPRSPGHGWRLPRVLQVRSARKSSGQKGRRAVL